MNISQKDLNQIIKEELEAVLEGAAGSSPIPEAGEVYVNAADVRTQEKEVIILPNTNMRHVSFQFLGNGYADTFGYVKMQKVKMSLETFRRNFAKKEFGIDPETGGDKVEPIYTLGNRDEKVNESVTKEEIVWLLENYGGEELPGKPNCGCGKDPCETYGSLDATVDGNVLDVDMSSMTITGKPDHEVEMARKQLRKTADYAGKLQGMMDGIPETNLPAWVQAKITTSSEDIGKVYHYLEEYLASFLMGKGMADGEDAAISGEITSVNEREI